MADYREVGRQAVAEHLTVGEVACRCNGCDGVVGQMHVDALVGWEKLRTAWGSPITVARGWSCEKHNAAVGGRPRSRHLVGLAFDLAVPGADYLSEEFFELLLVAGCRGIGRTATQLHVDWRPLPAPAYFWTYVAGGRARDEDGFAIYRRWRKGR